MYNEGETVEDLLDFFTNLSKDKLLRIIKKNQWYNSKIEFSIPKNYVRKYNRIPPENVYKNMFGVYIDKDSGIVWKDGYYSCYAYFKGGKSVFSGYYKTVKEVIQKLHEIYEENNVKIPEKFGYDIL